MRPLQSIAMGLVIVACDRPARQRVRRPAGPVGWLLVLLGVRGLPGDLPRRGAVVTLAWLAAAVSVPLWFPGVSDAAYATHPSLGWALNLPQLGFAALLCHSLATRAVAAEDRKAGSWLRMAMAGFVAAALLPVVVFGAGVASLEVATYVGAALVLIALIWLLFAYSARPWAVDQAADHPAE